MIRKILLCGLLPMSVLSVMAQIQASSDTVMSVVDPQRVVITESPLGFNVIVDKDTSDVSERMEYNKEFSDPVKVESHKWSGLLSVNRKSDLRWDITMGGPGIGWINSCGQPAGMGAEMGKSLEISWLNMIAVKYRLPWNTSVLSVGFGLDWRNYRISTSDSRFIPCDGGVAIGPYPDGISSAEGSRLKVFSMGVPVIWTQRLPFRWFGDYCLLGVGAVFNYSSHASLRTTWITASGEKAEQYSDRIGHRRFSVDLIGLVRVWGGLNVYVRWSPNSVLRGAGQPRFNPLSSGLILYY